MYIGEQYWTMGIQPIEIIERRRTVANGEGLIIWPSQGWVRFPWRQSLAKRRLPGLRQASHNLRVELPAVLSIREGRSISRDGTVFGIKFRVQIPTWLKRQC